MSCKTRASIRVFILLAAAMSCAASSAELTRTESFPLSGVAPRLSAGARISLPSFEGGSVDLDLGVRRRSPAGIATYTGKTPGAWLNDATVVEARDGFVATVRNAPAGTMLSISLRNGIWTVREERLRTRGKCGTPRTLPSNKPAQNDPKSFMARGRLTGDPLKDGAAFLARKETVTNVIDVLVGVDASAASWIRSRSQFAGEGNAVDLFAAEAVARCNSMYANTDLDRYFTFNLAGTVEIGIDCSAIRTGYDEIDGGYVDSSTILDFVSRYEQPKSQTERTEYAKVAAAREETGADIVSFLVSGGNEDGGGIVGIGFALSDETISEAEFANYAYNVCLVESVAGGNTMAHEIGHNMGAGHAKMADEDNSGPQLYSYSSGYYFDVTNANGDVCMHAGTIMAYNSDGFDDLYDINERWGEPPDYAICRDDWAYGLYTEVEYFSSPNHTYRRFDAENGELVDTGVKLGDELHDNTRILSLTYPLVANFRLKKSFVSVDIAGNGSGTVSGAGSHPVGKTVLLKAVPARDGSVFAGWLDESGATISKSAAYSLTAPRGGIALTAVFATADEDRRSLSVKATDLTTLPDGTIGNAGPDGTRSFDLGSFVNSLSPAKLAVSGLPQGLKYDAKTMSITGKAAKPGIYAVTVKATNATVTKPAEAPTATFTIKVPNFTDATIPVEDSYGPFIPGVAYTNLLDAAAGCAVTGLPAGMKWTAKDIADPRTKSVAIPANSFYGAAAKPGDYMVFFTKTSKETGANGKTASVKHVATATFTVSRFPVLSVATAGNGTGKTSGAGAYAANRKVTLKATADSINAAATPSKPETRKSVFAGWYDADGLVSLSANLPVVMPDADMSLTAKFITADEDKASISLSLDGSELLRDGTATPFGTNVWCGVHLEWPVAADAESGASVKVSGLPAGLKFTAKNIFAKGSKTEIETPANTIYGAPAAASKTGKDGSVAPSKVKVTVTTGGKTSVTETFDLVVDALPAWAVGTFDGCVHVAGSGEEETGDGTAGTVSLAVAANGKISGKILEGGATWTLGAAGFDKTDGGKFVATVAGKSGKDAFSGEIAVMEDSFGGIVSSLLPLPSSLFPHSSPLSLLAWQNRWKTEPWKSAAKPFAAAPALVLYIDENGAAFPEMPDAPYGTITLKFAAAGTAKASGKFTTGQDSRGRDVVHSASCSGVLTPSNGGFAENLPPQSSSQFYRIFLYFPPKAGRFDGFAAEIPLEWNGSEFGLQE